MKRLPWYNHHIIHLPLSTPVIAACELLAASAAELPAAGKDASDAGADPGKGKKRAGMCFVRPRQILKKMPSYSMF